MGTHKLLALIALAGIPFLAPAETYKYMDEEGRVHYTYSPPKAVKHATVPDLGEPTVAPADRSLAQAQARKDIEATGEHSKPAGSRITTGPATER